MTEVDREANQYLKLHFEQLMSKIAGPDTPVFDDSAPNASQLHRSAHMHTHLKYV